MRINPFFNYSSEQCLVAIAEIQERLVNGAQSVSHAGTGSATHYTAGEDKENLYWLAKRYFQLHPDDEDLTAQEIRAFVVTHVGYR